MKINVYDYPRFKQQYDIDRTIGYSITKYLIEIGFKSAKYLPNEPIYSWKMNKKEATIFILKFS